jgi:rhodanese-related sulfurtransferase
VDTNALATLLAAKTPVTVLDARTGKYDDGRRIPGAKTLSAKATAAEAAKLIPSMDALVVTYCTSPKCPASKMLAERLAGLGYKNILKYPAGIEGWAAAGNTVVKAQ